MINAESWHGKFEIYIGNELVKTIDNRVMNAALNSLIGNLTATQTNLQIKYLAVGTSNTAVTDTQTQLGAEFFRTAPITAPTITNVGEVTTEFILLDTEAVGAIKELGIFVGSSATSTANSGIMLSRVLWDKTKTNSEEITIKRIDKVVRS